MPRRHGRADDAGDAELRRTDTYGAVPPRPAADATANRLAGVGWMEDGGSPDATPGPRARSRSPSPRRGLTLELASETEDSDTDMWVAQWAYTRKGGNELSIRVGDRMRVLSKRDRDWWRVRLGGQTGEVPASYLAPADGAVVHRSRAGSPNRSRSPARRSPSPTRRARSPQRSASRSPSRRRSGSPLRDGRRRSSPLRDGRRGSPLSPSRSRVIVVHNMIGDEQGDEIPDSELELLEE